MQNRQLCLVPGGERGGVDQRASRRVRKVDRAEDVFERDHLVTPSFVPLSRVFRAAAAGQRT